MKYTFELKKDIETIQDDLKVSLKADTVDAVVSGYINTKQVDGKTIVEVFTYDKDEPANYVEGIYKNIPYNHGHKTSFVSVKEDLTDKVSDFEKKG